MPHCRKRLPSGLRSMACPGTTQQTDPQIPCVLSHVYNLVMVQGIRTKILNMRKFLSTRREYAACLKWVSFNVVYRVILLVFKDKATTSDSERHDAFPAVVSCDFNKCQGPNADRGWVMHTVDMSGQIWKKKSTHIYTSPAPLCMNFCFPAKVSLLRQHSLNTGPSQVAHLLLQMWCSKFLHWICLTYLNITHGTPQSPTVYYAEKAKTCETEYRQAPMRLLAI